MSSHPTPGEPLTPGTLFGISQEAAFSLIINHLSIEILTSLPVVIRFWPFCPNYSFLFQPKPRLMDHLEAANTALPFPRDLRPDFSAWQPPKAALELAQAIWAEEEEEELMDPKAPTQQQPQRLLGSGRD